MAVLTLALADDMYRKVVHVPSPHAQHEHIQRREVAWLVCHTYLVWGGGCCRRPAAPKNAATQEEVERLLPAWQQAESW
jgi:hypothetical protein